MKPGVAIEAARIEMASISDALAAETPAAPPASIAIHTANPHQRDVIPGARVLITLTTPLSDSALEAVALADNAQASETPMPAAIVMLALALRREHLAVFKLLVAWGIVLNVVTVAILALLHPPA